MNNSNQDPNTIKHRREWQPYPLIEAGKLKRFCFDSNAKLSNQILEIANNSRRDMSKTIRQLLYLGIEQYNLNKIAGITTRKQREQHIAKQTAEAEAMAAKRRQDKQRRGKKDTAVTAAATPMLYGIDTDAEE